jgi:drug/metabolite transporter (DMT)-like permease
MSRAPTVAELERGVKERPLAATVVGGISSSGAAVFVALAAVSPGTAAFFRFAIAALLLAPLARVAGGITMLRASLSAKALAAGALLAGDALLWNQAISGSGAGIATVIVNLQVVFVPLLAWLVHGQRPTPLFALAVPAMLVGVALAGGLGSQSTTGADPAAGVVLASGAALCYAGFLFLLREAGESGGALGTVLVMTIAAAAVSLIVAPFWHGLELTPGLGALGWLAVVALTSQVIAYLLIAPALPRLTPSLGAAVLLIQPIGSLALAAVALGEQPTVLQLGGCALVLAAVFGAPRAEA